MKATIVEKYKTTEFPMITNTVIKATTEILGYRWKVESKVFLVVSKKEFKFEGACRRSLKKTADEQGWKLTEIIKTMQSGSGFLV